MSPAAITITAKQRRVLHRLLAERLARADVAYLHLVEGRPAEAESAGIEVAQDLGLMAEIGWDPEDRRESFGIGLSAADLLEILTRFAEDAERSIFNVGVEYGLNNADAASMARCAAVCRDLIASLDPRTQKLAIGPDERSELRWLVSYSLFRPGAERAGIEAFGEDMRLMIGLGWLEGDHLRALGWPEPEAGEIAVPLEADQFGGALERLRSLAESEASTRDQDAAAAAKAARRQFASAARVCEELLTRLTNKSKGGAK